MFDHVTIRVSDRSASERFYDTVLVALGRERSSSDESFVEWGDFSLTEADGETPVTRRLHVGFAAPSREHVDAFWRAGVEAGARDDGAPGPRPEYGDDYYGGFLLDPDGVSAEAVHHGGRREDGIVDHLWLRVADLSASREFYALVGRHAGFRLELDTPGRAQFTGASGSFSLLPGEPSENVHVAFAIADPAAADAFHRDATAAGYRDNGAPGERPDYGPGYYAAFVLDPDGNNVELVRR